MKRITLEIPDKIGDVLSLTLIGHSNPLCTNTTALCERIQDRNNQILVIDADDSSKTHWKDTVREMKIDE